MANRHILTVVVLIVVVLAILRLSGTYAIPVLDQLDRFTLGSQQAA